MNPIAIVTGGSRGYGHGIAAKLRAGGFEVWITGRDEAALAAAASQLGVRAQRADVTCGNDWDALVRRVLELHGRIDLLVNNAGSGETIAPIDEQSDDSIAKSVAINLVGPLLGCRRVAPVMKQQRSGLIVNISSGCARHAWPGWGPYSAAKAGLNQFGHCLHTELRPFGVRVTNIIPYWGATNFAAAANLAEHPLNDSQVRDQAMQPSEMGELVWQLWNTPAHLCVPDVTIQPMIQEIVPY